MEKSLSINCEVKPALFRKVISWTALVLSLLFGGLEGYSKNAKPNPSRSISSIVQPHRQADQSDFSSIDVVVKAMYEAITFGEGEAPDLDRLRSLFIPNAPFVRVTPGGVIKTDLDGFVSSFSNRVRTGVLKSFFEAEISRKTQLYGSIAQVWSSYKKGMNTEDPESFGRGINSMQLYYDGKRWRISCILWQDETKDSPIPEEYLR